MTSHLCRPLAITISTKFRFPIRQARSVSYDADERSAQRSQIERWKHPSRGGQNLSDRYHRLAKSLRGKEAFSKKIQELPGSSTVPASGQVAGDWKPQPQREDTSFRGLLVPTQPKPPEPDECCMSGCAICVHDLYQEALEEYNESIAALRTTLSARHIPDSEWPVSVQPSGQKAAQKSASLSAFEELERALEAKHQQRGS
ncbi:hypothetical protein PLICRDRAFT_117598 [Plicaturopsis crispa FD-325 SS-3]|uniref:Oxidoreductase-like domain-containing protein n=1 Tax=Plicaturopsis crispa FD-325 SS-3 TaxID=944288 RepID=A0A0C9SKY8_PLICR|nr:hypothetical protein PLICRDRAFT_117598 [Plicaturopsis crispa FD-325 SS-3]